MKAATVATNPMQLMNSGISMKYTQISLSILMLCSLSACGLMQQQQAVQSSANMTEAKIASVSKDTIAKVQDFRNVFERNQDVDAPWLAGRSIALAKEVTIPAALRNNVRVTTLASQCTTSLTALTVCLSSTTGIPMRVKPDALMPLALFVPRGSTSSAPSAASAVRPTSTAAPTGNTPAQASSGPGFAVDGVEIPIHKLLSMMDGYWGVSHKLNDDGVLEFYRLETRVMRLKALAQQMNSVSKLATGFNDSSNTTMEIKNQDPVSSMRATLLAMGTLAGDVMISSDTKAVTVTDTPESIARIANYLEEENKRLTRRVTLIVEELVVTRRDLAEFSIDWNIVYGAISNATTANRQRSPGSLASALAGSLTLPVQGAGKFAGTSVLVNALSEQGLTVASRSFPVSTLNGTPYSLGLPTIFDYVDKAQTNIATSGQGIVITPSISQKEDKIGSFVTITPDAQDDGQILVALKFENRSGTLTPYTVTASGGSVGVQQRNIDEINGIGKTVLRMGIPTIFGGVSELTDESQGRRLDADAPMLLGGSDKIKRQKRSLILVITALAEDGV
jgi:type IVB pilus formation R64 PilN family outer membrane protein